MSTPAGATPAVALVVAAKVLPRAKSRLVAGLPAAVREPLVLALLADTLAAARRSPHVASLAVVTADATVAALARRLGADVVDEPPGETGLDAAVRRGEGAVRAAGAGWVAALQGDLPALRPDQLGAALGAALAHGGRSVVPDAEGTGTTLLVAPGPLEPAFGPGSAAAHTGSGAHRLDGAWPGLRRDVDTPADLAAALALGAGPATTAAVAGWGTAATVAGVGADGTVALRRDDGTALTAPAAATAAGGWRALRMGQRVRALPDDTGAVLLVTVPALDPPG